jgi:hypothetical protein
MNVLQNDPAWRAVGDFLQRHIPDEARIFAPVEFSELFSRVVYYNSFVYFGMEQIDVFVIHKGRLDQIPRELCLDLIQSGTPLFGNEVFVVYARKGRRFFKKKGNVHVRNFRETVVKPQPLPVCAAPHSEFAEPATVVVMTTFNRPHHLARSLRSIIRLGVPILVVDDGSDPVHRTEYDSLALEFGVRMLHLPGNRGLANAVNTGVSYWLSDPQVEWISYLQDDVEVHPDLLEILRHVQDAEKYPLLTGRQNHLAKIYGEETVKGERVLQQRMVPGLHLHAHRSYWEKILPIPTFYFQAPRRVPGVGSQGSGVDWWITQWSPQSVGQQGEYVAVVPDLVRTFSVLAEESSWGNPGPEDPALAGSEIQRETKGLIVPAGPEPALVDTTSNLNAAEQACFVACLETSRHYLEYGSGESTRKAVLQSKLLSITSVESSAHYLEESLLGEDAIFVAHQSGRLKFLLPDLGPLGEWGRPINSDKMHLWPNYALCPYRQGFRPDLVLIDGRFRVACALVSLLEGTLETTLLIHDYMNRKQYHVLEEFIQIEKIVDTLVACHRRADIDEDRARRLLKEYLYAPDDFLRYPGVS